MENGKWKIKEDILVFNMGLGKFSDYESALTL